MTAPGPAKSARPFVVTAIAGLITAIVAFVPMQVALNVHGSGAVVFHIVGLALFLIWLASMVAAIVGIIGAVVRSARQHRSG